LKTQVKNVAGGATVSQYDYQYDAVGRRGSVVNSGSAFAMPAFSKWNYNDRNELIESARYEGANVGHVSLPVMEEYRAYGFDAIGNRTGASEAGTMKSYSANALNEYTGAAGATLTYDADGNLTNDGARKFTYDGENRLTVVEPVTPGNGAVRVRMAYDYLGRRVQKLVDEYGGSMWTNEEDVRFVYVGWNVIEERHTSAGVSTKKDFVWGLDLSQSMDGAGGIGGLLAVVDEAGTQMTFAYDANGNVGQLVDEGGSTIAKYEYDAFGQTVVASGAAAGENAYRFSTKYADVETGLVYYGYRFYHAGLGRWVNRDPASEYGGINLHAYLTNRTVDDADYLGRHSYRAGSFTARPWQPHTRAGSPGQAGVDLWMEAVNQLPYIAVFSWPAFQHSQHYLFGHGEPIDLPFGQVIEDETYAMLGSAKLVTDIVEDLGDAMRFVENTTGTPRGRITSASWNRNQLWTVKWLFALGAILWSGDATYESTGSCSKLKMKCHLWDPYDFETNDPTHNGLLTSGQYRRLHDVGLATEYLITGETPEFTIEWKKGGSRALQKSDLDFRVGGRIRL
jgi:RHS repeat-associated protein